MSTPGAARFSDMRSLRSSHRLGGSVAVLVLLDAVGGLVAISSGINRVGEAWGSKARLAAPWPMIAAQAGLTLLAVGQWRAVARGASVALGLACLVSAISGFFDGGVAAKGLAPRHVAFQIVLICWTALTGALAVNHAAHVTQR